MYVLLVGDNDIDYTRAYGPFANHEDAVAAETLFAESSACNADAGEDLPRAVRVEPYDDLLVRIAEGG